MLPQLDFFCHFWDISQDTWQALKCGVAPLFVETNLTPASHTPDLYVCGASGKQGFNLAKQTILFTPDQSVTLCSNRATLQHYMVINIFVFLTLIYTLQQHRHCGSHCPCKVTYS